MFRPHRWSGQRFVTEILEDRLAPAGLDFGQLPLAFEANVGQTDAQVEFLARGQGYGLFLTGAEAVLSLYDPRQFDDPGTVLRAQFVGADPHAPAVGLDQLEGHANYYVGNDPSQWHTDVPMFGRVSYQAIYPGIDLVYYGTNQQQLEFDFVVAPGVDPNIIRVNYEGASGMELDAAGNLVLHTAAGVVVQHAPVIYQETTSGRQAVSGRFALEGTTVGFHLGAYDPTLPLVIDPVVDYSTYHGGSGQEEILGVFIRNRTYVTGYTRSANFPTAGASADTSLAGTSDAFVVRMNPAATGLTYCTYLGGSGRENDLPTLGGHGAVNALYLQQLNGEGAAVTGFTQSSDFPLLNALDSTLGGVQDAFLVTLNNQGGLIFSTYLGGSGSEAGTGIDGLCVTGWTDSTDLPVVGAVQATSGGGRDAFVAQVNGAYTAVTFCSYLGGSGTDTALDIGLDSAGNRFITGRTASANFPTTAGLDQTLGGSADAFLTKINAAGTVMLFSTFLGGSGEEDFDPAHNTDVGSLVVDVANNVYVTGSTSSSDFPRLGPFDNALGGSWDAYVTKFDASGTTVYSTFLGGAGNDIGMGIAVNDGRYAFVTGYTESGDFPTINPTQAALAGSRDAFVTVFDDLGIAPVYSSFLGGSGGTEGDIGRSIAVDGQGRAVVVGYTDSAFPTVVPRQGTYGGNGDGFITRIAVISGATISWSNSFGGGSLYVPGTWGDADIAEGGPFDTYNVVLNGPPTANVIITINTDAQVTASPTTLTFTPAAWSTAQTVTLNAVDDAVNETRLPARHTGIVTHTFTSADPSYNGIGSPGVSCFIKDNDQVGVYYNLFPASASPLNGPGFAVLETGSTTDLFDMELTSTPTADVFVVLNANGQVTATSQTFTTLTFTTATWSNPQRITVTAIDDALPEATPHNGIITPVFTSADPAYNGLSGVSVTIPITDNDNALVLIDDIDGSIRVTENGPTDVYTVVLGSPPSADVVITVGTGTQVTPSPGTLTFTPANWSTLQTVTLAAVNDLSDESRYPTLHSGDTITHIASSADAAYNGVAIPSLSARVYDNDFVSIYLSQSGGATGVNEQGPTTDTYVVVLTSTPTANVFITITPDAQVASAPTVLTFTPTNWFAVQTVNVTPIDDGVIEGPHNGVLTHTVTSADSTYNAYVLPSITAAITDNDAVGVFLLETLASTGVSETGATSDVYSLRLLSVPAANVVVTLGPGSQLATSLSVVTYTPLDWNVPQTVTVTAVDDLIAETALHTGLVTHTASSTDPAYNGAFASLTVDITDNDTAGISLTQSGGATNVSEAGGSDDYTITLATQPTANVLVTLNADAQVSVAASVLTFTPANWNVTQTVTLTAVDDFMVEVSPHQGVVAHIVASTDPFYNGLPLNAVTANITDNDIGGVAVTQTGGTTDVTEGAASDTYTIVLSSLPSANVVITVASSAQATVSSARLTFTPGNWNVQQTITVTAVDDAVFEGPHNGVITHTPSSADPVYNGISIGAVTANITDNDAVGILQSGGSTSLAESGATDTYTLVLASMPSADVFINFTPGSQLAVAPAPLTFTPANWNVPQMVTVSAVNDLVAESTHSGVIRHISTSADANYNGVVVVDVTAQIADNDVAGATVTASGGSTDVTEGVGSDLYDIVLNTQPTTSVSITLTPDTGLVVAPTVLVFTPASWNVPQTVTVTAPDDGIQQGPRVRVITHAVSSSDPFYQPIAVANMPVQLTDPPGVTITATNGTNAVIEGATQSYAIRLNTAPTAPVTIDLTSAGQVAVAPSQVVFGPSDWNVPRPLFVTAIDDSAIEGPHSGTLSVNVSGADPIYNTLVVSDFAAAVIDNDGAPVLGTNRADQIVVMFDATQIVVSINSQQKMLPLPLGQLVIHGGDGNDNIQIVSPTVPVVVVAGRGSDKVFATGRNGPNRFVLDNGSIFVNGVSVQVWETENLIANGRADSDTFSVTGVPGFAVEFKGDAGNDQVIGPDRVNAWQITGPATGTLDRTIKLNGVENWTGGLRGDTFAFSAGKALGGTIDGGGGSDVLDYTAYTAAVTVYLETATATGAIRFANIARIVGGKSSADKLIGPNQALTWNITGANAGDVGGIAFQNVENLTGGNLDDTFHFANGQSVRGKIDGGAGTDHLDYSAFASKAVVINLQTKTATSTAGFLNIEQFSGGNGTLLDTLLGANLNSVWTLTDRGAGSVASPLPAPLLFAGFENLTGGTLSDVFTLTTALSDWLGTLNGGSGKDVLTAFQGQANLYVNTTAYAGTLNGRKFLNIESRR